MIKAAIGKLKEGTKAIKEFFEELLAALVKWIYNLLGIQKAVAESKTDELYRAVKTRLSKITHEEILSVKSLKALRTELREVFGVDLKIVGKDPGTKERLRKWNSRISKPAASFSDVKKTIFVRSEVSAYTVEHEMLHMKLWYKMTQEFSQMAEAYSKLTKLQHEEYVLAEFIKSAEKWAEIELRRDLDTINTLRQDTPGLNPVDLEYFKNWKFPE